MHILSNGNCAWRAGCGPGTSARQGFPGEEDSREPKPQVKRDYLKGIAVCCEVYPTLGTEPQNILTVGMYLVMFPVGAVWPNTWKRQFSTSAT